MPPKCRSRLSLLRDARSVAILAVSLAVRLAWRALATFSQLDDCQSQHQRGHRQQEKHDCQAKRVVSSPQMSDDGSYKE